MNRIIVLATTWEAYYAFLQEAKPNRGNAVYLTTNSRSAESLLRGRQKPVEITIANKDWFSCVHLEFLYFIDELEAQGRITLNYEYKAKGQTR